MANLSAVLDRLGGYDSGCVSVLRGQVDRPVIEVRLIEQLEQIDRAAADSLLVLGRNLIPLLHDYRLDVALRRAAHRKVGVIMMVCEPEQSVSMTAAALADRAGITLLGLTPEADLTAAVEAMVQEVLDTLALSVDRVRRICEAMRSTAADTLDELLEAVSELLGKPVRLGPPPGIAGSDPTLLGVPAVVTDPTGSWLVSDRFDDPASDALLEMVLWRVAGEASRSSWERERAEAARRRSVGEVLLQLVTADRDGRAQMVPSARRLGLHVDGWHTLARIEFDNLLELADDDVAAYQARDEFVELVRTATEKLPGWCNVGHSQEMILVLWTVDAPPRPADVDHFCDRVRAILTLLENKMAHLRTYCGVGTAHAAVNGLATSATEARIATASARLRRVENSVVGYDSVGMHTTLLEWHSSPAVQQGIERLFAPLAAMSQQRRHLTLRTVATYLDFQGNIAKTAEVLHLHRNAVRYRIQRAFDLLGVDQGDADQRLFLHLACRSQLMVGD